MFDVIAQPYSSRRSRALADKITLLHTSADMVLAAHHTPIRRGLVATTVETVRFARPDRIDFRLVRGPVPYVTETFALSDHDNHTRLTYTGVLGTDLWAPGQAWGDAVAVSWQKTVADSLATIKAEAERRSNRPFRAPTKNMD